MGNTWVTIPGYSDRAKRNDKMELWTAWILSHSWLMYTEFKRLRHSIWKCKAIKCLLFMSSWSTSAFRSDLSCNTELEWWLACSFIESLIALASGRRPPNLLALSAHHPDSFAIRRVGSAEEGSTFNKKVKVSTHLAFETFKLPTILSWVVRSGDRARWKDNSLNMEPRFDPKHVWNTWKNEWITKPGMRILAKCPGGGQVSLSSKQEPRLREACRSCPC